MFHPRQDLPSLGGHDGLGVPRNDVYARPRGKAADDLEITFAVHVKRHAHPLEFPQGLGCVLRYDPGQPVVSGPGRGR
jgi:hypothetical protein